MEGPCKGGLLGGKGHALVVGSAIDDGGAAAGDCRRQGGRQEAKEEEVVEGVHGSTSTS